MAATPSAAEIAAEIATTRLRWVRHTHTLAADLQM